MYKLAITGGIGSGKTTVSSFINENYKSVYLFNADKESKSHLKKSLSLQHKIINIFGSTVTVNNRLDIKKLAEVVFSNKVDQDILNGIMWAEVFILINNKIEESENTIQKTMSDINQILHITNKKSAKNIYIYVIPPELKKYKEAESFLSNIFNTNIQIFASNDSKKIDPDSKSRKAKPGKPGIYIN